MAVAARFLIVMSFICIMRICIICMLCMSYARHVHDSVYAHAHICSVRRCASGVKVCTCANVMGAGHERGPQLFRILTIVMKRPNSVFYA